jgi:hypothetical protein
MGFSPLEKEDKNVFAIKTLVICLWHNVFASNYKVFLVLVAKPTFLQQKHKKTQLFKENFP